MLISAERKKKTEVKIIPEDNTSQIDRVYYCPNHTGTNFYIFKLDAEGKKIPQMNRAGEKKLLNGEIMYEETCVRFETIERGTKENPDKTMCIYRLDADDKRYKDKFEALEQLRLDQSTWVMNQRMYDEYTNSAAAEFKYENAALKDQNKQLASTVEDLKKQLEELQAKGK